MRHKVSSWVRQARHRAKKHNVTNDLDVRTIHDLLDEFKQLCAYCSEPAVTLDHPFPLSDKAPNVLANVLPCCQVCKTLKGVSDLVTFHTTGHIAKDQFIAIIRGMLTRAGCNNLREHIKGITGIGL